MARKRKTKNNYGYMVIWIMILIVVASISLVFILSASFVQDQRKYQDIFARLGDPFNISLHQTNEIKAFSSPDELASYISQISEFDSYSGSARNMVLEAAPSAMDGTDEWGLNDLQNINLGLGGESQRVSGTNVQVEGIDEPDILKTDGKEIYFSGTQNYYYFDGPMPVMDIDVIGSEDIMPPEQYEQPKTNLINAWPIEDLGLDSQILETGDLLYKDNILVVLSGRYLYAYDVSDKQNPAKTWTLKLEDRQNYRTARLMGDKIYLVTSTYLNNNYRCPMPLLEVDGTSTSLDCTYIYHPVDPGPANISYNVVSLDMESGEVKDQVAFLGNSGSSVVYMSEKNIYITYEERFDQFQFMYTFFTEKASDLVPQNIISRMAKLNSYDISYRAKIVELETIFEEWYQTIDEDEAMLLENEFENRIQDFMEENKRNLIRSGIVKIDLDNLSVRANGVVPGTPLNQFSLDEYDNNLRIATTIGRGWFGFGRLDESANDVYVLDKNLKVKGSILDLGLTEEIYSARFIGDRGYLVTFRRTDPFYVLDLSQANNPQMTGELKIPGYSSYLHPISDEKVLGIGEEDNQVKISYFDVSDPSSPQEIDKYILDEYDSETLRNHHAFLLDTKHQVFFLPGSQGGYVFSYTDDKLELVRAVSMSQVKRALYIDDYMYIVAEDYIVILDENDWEKVNELDLDEAEADL
ncbi:hypothetical protein C0580_01245 [Candidatus Parcubacteria bacterium]|nr:MAG: hypothetical protein C0580_01245 [Candidatus Parcubacteria bacterium]